MHGQAWQLPFPHPQPERTWADLVRRWQREGAAWKSSRTLELEAQLITWLGARLQGRTLPDIDWSVVDGIVDELADSDRGPATINRYLSLLRAMLNAAVAWRWLSFIPKVPHLRNRRRRVRWLTYPQAQLLLGHLPDHLADMASFSLETGLRRSNVTGLRWTQTDLQKRLAWIHADEAKARRAIPVPLSLTACRILEKRRHDHPEFVFTYQGRRVHQTNTKAWRAALERAGITDFRWHDLRHTWASWHAQEGTPPDVLRELGGWADERMVRHYAHLSAEHLQPHVDRLHTSLRRRLRSQDDQP